jgi:outer membrane scaffolding protein for murein synthesis (MipA/OmpV family)
MLDTTRALRAIAAALAATALAAGAASAQGLSVAGEVGLGARYAPDYFGAGTSSFGPTASGSLHGFSLGSLSFGDPDPDAVRYGFGLRPSFRLISERSAADNPELAGMTDVDMALELGLGAAYRGEMFEVFADARYGVLGHEAWVGEIGADLILQPADGLTLSLGPRAFYGSDAYAATYFGVTPAEAGLSAFPAFAASGGLLSLGLEAEVEQRLNDDWSIRGNLTVSELQNAAAASPITAQGESLQTEVTVTLIRQFSFGF